MNRINALSFAVKELNNQYDSFKLKSVTINSDGTGTGEVLLPDGQSILFEIKHDSSRIEII